MPTLYSLTDDFSGEVEKQAEFLETIRNLKKQFGQMKAGAYIIDAVDQIHSLLEESTKRRDNSEAIRNRIKGLLEDEKFKRGASVIEFPKEAALDKKTNVENKKLLKFFEEKGQDLQNLKRYTIDSIKEAIEVIDPAKKTTREVTKVRVIEAVLNMERLETGGNKMTLSDLLNSRNWLEEDRDEKGEAIVYHKDLEKLDELFPTKGLSLTEGRVILGNKERAFDITELVRQIAKESYKKLVKSEGRNLKGRGIKR